MIKNWFIYLGTAAVLFVFSAFHSFEKTTWNIFLLFAFVPLVSLAVSLPFMINAAKKGLTAVVPHEIRKGGSVEIKIYSASKHAVFPQLKVRVVYKNSFASDKRRYRKITFFGSTKKPFVIINKSLSRHCGTAVLSLKACRVCDFTGMFFLPVRIKETPAISILPELIKPSFIPDADNSQVLGFKPKPGGGFSDYYELRPYRDGDSMKNVHWKVSSKYDELIVREPSLPVLKDLVVRLDLTNDSDVNDSIIARFVYTAEKLVSDGKDFYCLTANTGYYKIESREDILNSLTGIYNCRRGISSGFDSADMLIIGANGEEVVDA